MSRTVLRKDNKVNYRDKTVVNLKEVYLDKIIDDAYSFVSRNKMAYSIYFCLDKNELSWKKKYVCVLSYVSSKNFQNKICPIIICFLI